MFSHDFCLEELIKFSPAEAIFSRDNKGLTIFHCVAQSGSCDVLSLLMSQEELFEQVGLQQRLVECDNKGRTPLQIAAAAGHEPLVRTGSLSGASHSRVFIFSKANKNYNVIKILMGKATHLQGGQL